MRKTKANKTGKGKGQVTLFTEREIDRYRKPGTVQRRLFDAVRESGV